MCIGGSASPIAPVAQTAYRDTSKDPIVSNFPLSEAQKAENRRRASAKNKSKSLVRFDSDDNQTGTGVTFSGTVPSGRSFNTEQATGFGMDL